MKKEDREFIEAVDKTLGTHLKRFMYSLVLKGFLLTGLILAINFVVMWLMLGR